MKTRRDFLVSSLASGAALLATKPSAALRAAQSTAVDTHIEVLVNEPIATIAPEIYGHFAEHLGGVVYDGIWVGENSKVPNAGGIRLALVEALKRIKASVIRWPGGCFADQYDWRDGIGPRDKRPTRVNFWADTTYKAPQNYQKLEGGPQKYESNYFGTDEFARFCKMVNAPMYLAANLRTRDARVFQEWLDYCNSPANTTSWSKERAKNGSVEHPTCQLQFPPIAQAVRFLNLEYFPFAVVSQLEQDSLFFGDREPVIAGTSISEIHNSLVCVSCHGLNRQAAVALS